MKSKRFWSALAATILAMPATFAASVPAQQAYIKPFNTGAGDSFGVSVAISGNTMVVGAQGEDSSSTGVNGPDNGSATDSGGAYIFVRNGTNWIQQAYLKASNAEAGDVFGRTVSISGNTVVVGATGEDSNATGVNGDGSNNSSVNSGAAYVFVRNGTNWTQQAYIKASNTGPDAFGAAVAISGDTIVIGAYFEASNARGVNGDQSNNSAAVSGAAYVFARTGTNWSQQAYLKASDSVPRAYFGYSVAVSGDTVLVGSPQTPLSTGGAAYVFVRSGTNWTEQTILHASNVGTYDGFGNSVSLSGETAVVGSLFEDSSATGVNGAQGDVDINFNSGAAYVFVRKGTNWSQEAYLKASNTGQFDAFGNVVAISGDTIAVGTGNESSDATGVNGDGGNDNAPQSGAAYVFVRSGTNWSQQAYLKASNTETNDAFGLVAVSGDTVVVATSREDSNATGVNGDQSNNLAPDSGAAYVFTGLGIGAPLSILADGSGGYFIRCNSITGFTYQWQSATSVNGLWSTNATMTALSSGLIEYHDTNAPPGQAFYRVVQVAQ